MEYEILILRPDGVTLPFLDGDPQPYFTAVQAAINARAQAGWRVVLYKPYDHALLSKRDSAEDA